MQNVSDTRSIVRCTGAGTPGSLKHPIGLRSQAEARCSKMYGSRTDPSRQHCPDRARYLRGEAPAIAPWSLVLVCGFGARALGKLSRRDEGTVTISGLNPTRARLLHGACNLPRAERSATSKRNYAGNRKPSILPGQVQKSRCSSRQV